MISVFWQMLLKLGQFPGWEKSSGASLLFFHISCIDIIPLLIVMGPLIMLRKDCCWPDIFIVQGSPGQVPSGHINVCLMLLDIITFGVFPIQSMWPGLVFGW